MLINRVFFAILGFILLIILVIILFPSGKKAPTGPPPKTLPQYATTDATVSMTIDGPVNGDDAHRAIKVTVSNSERDLDIIQGYSGSVLSHQAFYNSSDAYSVFLKAINGGGFLLQRKKTPANLDDAGQCPLGERYIFTLQQDGDTISRLWTSSCGTKTGNFAGISDLMQSLFEAQITDYNTLTENVNF